MNMPLQETWGLIWIAWSVKYVKMLSLSQASWGITRGGGIEIASNEISIFLRNSLRIHIRIHMQRLQWCMYWFWCFEKTQRMHTGENHISQCLQVIFLCESMCVFSFIPPLHVTSQFSQVSTRSSCFDWMCILRCLSEGASMLHMTQEGMVTADSFYWQ